MILRDGSDFQARTTAGGSKRGRVTGEFNYHMREFVRQWMLKYVANGDEQVFIHSPQNKGYRWTLGVFGRLDLIMMKEFGEEYTAWRYTEGKDAVAALKDRHHKMYWYRRKRMYSPEHSDNRTDPEERKDIERGRVRFLDWVQRHPNF